MGEAKDKQRNFEKYVQDLKKNYLEKVPLKRMGEVNDLLGIIALLSSQYSNYITGQNIMVDGGFTAW